MLRLIATDMDGTLLSRDKNISQKNLEAIRIAQEKGVILALASGRGELSLREYAAQLDMYRYGGYLICNNGQRLVSLRDGLVVENAKLDGELVKRIFRFAKHHGIEMILEGDDGLSVFTPNNLIVVRFLYQRFMQILPHFRNDDGKNSWMSFFGIFQERRLHLVSTEQQLAPSYYKIGLAHRKRRLDAIVSKLSGEFGSEVSMSRVSDMWIDLVSHGVSKALGVKQIMDTHDIPVHAVMAIGDSENDLEMITFAGIGVAMKNGMASVREIADEITDTNDNDGVASVILKHL